MDLFKPVEWSFLIRQVKLHVLRAVVFLKMKQCGQLKVRACADGQKQRSLYSKEDTSSPTVQTKSVILRALIYVFKGKDVAIVGIPGAFLNAKFDPRILCTCVLKE